MANVPQSELKPCPFCGGKASFERMGTARVSCIISCDDCGCTLETGEVWNCGQTWNRRHAAAELQPQEIQAAVPTPAEIQAAKAVLLEQINTLPVAEIVRSAEWTVEQILAAAEAARSEEK